MNSIQDLMMGCGYNVGLVVTQQMIVQAQAALVAWGKSQGQIDPPDYTTSKDVDGKVGPRTQRAIGSFQRAAGIPQTGVLDDATMTALTPWMSGAPAPARTPPGVYAPPPTPYSPPKVSVSTMIPTNKTMLYVGIGAAVLVGAWWALRDKKAA